MKVREVVVTLKWQPQIQKSRNLDQMGRDIKDEKDSFIFHPGYVYRYLIAFK